MNKATQNESIYRKARRDWHWSRLAALLEAVGRRGPKAVRGAALEISLKLSRKG